MPKPGKSETKASAPKADLSKSIQGALTKIRRGTHEIIPEDGLVAKLVKSEKEGAPLLVKARFDPTAPDLHLGHVVLLRKLRHLQDLGHKVIFLIGDFTGMIGDPSGRSSIRKRMTKEDVAENAKTYEAQVFKFLDKSKTEVRFNSDWCMNMRFEDVLGLTARVTVARMIERDDFAKRLAAGDPVSMLELMYPLIQGYDSVVLKSDIELGGTDQKFNLLVGRELQGQFGMEEQVILTMPLLVGLDGQKKMSKSFGNFIAINETPYAMFAKVMSLSDELMWNYYLLLTDIPEKELEGLKAEPFEAKKRLGVLLVDMVHASGAGLEARNAWESEKSGSGRDKMILPPDTQVYKVTEKTPCKIKLTKIVVDAGLDKSISAVRRLIESGAVKMGEGLETVTDYDLELSFPGQYAVRLGKKKYLKIEG
ncbi:MAG: tyrosine--tRNA ligase [Spirochaetia bacterium]|nr:tyrosine--tRNA ligase [Spirochaetia bacterium]